MQITASFLSQSGEVALDIAPAPRLRVPEGSAWRRARYATGRALTAQVLEDEQVERALRAAALQDALAEGVLGGAGFETLLLQGPGGVADRILVSPGLGLSAGEDVLLPAPVQLRAAALPVWSGSLEDAGPAWTAEDRRLIQLGEAGQDASVAGWRLGALAARFAGRGLAPVAVLLARPLRLLRNLAPSGAACHDDPDPNDEDLAWDDALRFEWALWPQRLAPLPPRDSRWRNRIAWRIFDAEAAGRRWPWRDAGVPIALAGFDDLAAGRIAFLDRHAVVREGGGLRRRSALIVAPAAGPAEHCGAGADEPLAQAQLLQLAEQLAELDPAELDPQRLPLQFDRLPPAGLLPASVLQLDLGRQRIFPAGWGVEARVCTEDMVEALLAEAAPLAPLNLGRAEQVELLVPVPAAHWEPDLLRLDEAVDPLFALEIGRLERERLALLHERQAWMRGAERLEHAAGGLWPERDPREAAALADEQGDDSARAFPRVHRGGQAGSTALEAHGFAAAAATLRLAPGDRLVVYVEIERERPPATLILQPLRRRLVAATAADGTAASAADRGEAEAGPLLWWGTEPAWPTSADASLPRLQAGALPAAEAAPDPAAIDPPPPTRWLRLEVDASWLRPANTAADPDGGYTLEGLVYGTVLGEDGGAVHWGHAGALRGALERHWVGPDLPEAAAVDGTAARGALSGSRGRIEAEAALGHWAWIDRRADTTPRPLIEGLAVDGDSLRVTELLALDGQAASNPARIEMQQAVTRGETATTAPRALHTGLAPVVEALDRKGSASNDLVDFGFLRAKVDLYRLRTRLLGSEEADRLLTSPAVADLVKRGDTSYATDQQLTEYLQKAKAITPPAPTGPAIPAVAAPRSGPPAAPAPRGRRAAAAPVAARVAFTAVGLGDALNFSSAGTLPPAPPPGGGAAGAPLARAGSLAIGATSFGRVPVAAPLAATPFVATPVASPLIVTAISPTASASPSIALATLGGAAAAPVATLASDPALGTIAVSTALSEAAVQARVGGVLDLAGGGIVADRVLLPGGLSGGAPVPSAPNADSITAASNFNLSQNNVTLGDRLKTPVVVDTWTSAVAGKKSTIESTAGQLAELRLPLEQLQVFGYEARVDGNVTRPFTVTEFLGAAVKPKDLDLDDASLTSEADYFRKGIDAIDNSIRFMRGVEGLVASYRRLRSQGQAALERLRAQAQRCRAEIARLDRALAEVRHDLGVARALQAEERRRIAAVLARRRAVLARVERIAFRRPRLTRRVDDLPVRSVENGLFVSPVPACLDQAHGIPAELQRMVDSLRDLPARHFNRATELLRSLDDHGELLQLVGGAASRAASSLQARGIALGQLEASRSTAEAQGTARAGDAAGGASLTVAVQTLQLGLLQQAHQHAVATAQAVVQPTLAWSSLSSLAITHLSLADLLHSSRSLGASGELDEIARVAACLHAALGRVPPAVRLVWAQQLSVFDAARGQGPDLRQLGVLPRFGETGLGLDFDDWRGMQSLVDWLFGRIDASSAVALRLMSDLVRVCLLLAAQAPVKDLIPGRLLQPLRPVPGARLELAVEAWQAVRVGMRVDLGSGADQARAVVQDVAPGRVLAQVVEASASAGTLGAQTLVQLSRASVVLPSAFAAGRSAGR